MNSTGVSLSTTVTGFASGAFALDAAGNAHIAEAALQLFPVKNSVTTCGAAPADAGKSIGILTVGAITAASRRKRYMFGRK